jgi:hypothetical protein
MNLRSLVPWSSRDRGNAVTRYVDERQVKRIEID